MIAKMKTESLSGWPKLFYFETFKTGKAPMANCSLTIHFWAVLKRWPVCWFDSFIITECVPMVILVEDISFFLPFVYSLEKKMTLCQVRCRFGQNLDN